MIGAPETTGFTVKAPAAALAGFCALLVSGDALAQLRWDLGGSVGVEQRIKSDRPASSPTQLPGAIAELHGDVAVIPMVRAGAHVTFDVAPLDGLPLEHTLEGGLQIKFAPPLLSAPWRTWVEVGLGYGWAYEPAHGSRSGDASVAGASGGVFDVPVGLALGYRAGRGLEPFVELGARFGVAFAGSLYAPPGPGDGASPFLGRDVVALALSLGLNSNQ